MSQYDFGPETDEVLNRTMYNVHVIYVENPNDKNVDELDCGHDVVKGTDISYYMKKVHADLRAGEILRIEVTVANP